ncbi:hypothetical protein BHE74_00003452 [Ensete ventricosum]|nr:hypothetical protein BHE74_00003452 [Ensete ventricosum]
MVLSLLPPQRERMAHVRGAWLGSTGRPSEEEVEHDRVTGALGCSLAGAGAFIMSDMGRPYLRPLLHPLLTMPSYFFTPFVVLIARRAFCLLQL